MTYFNLKCITFYLEFTPHAEFKRVKVEVSKYLILFLTTQGHTNLVLTKTTVDQDKAKPEF